MQKGKGEKLEQKIITVKTEGQRMLTYKSNICLSFTIGLEYTCPFPCNSGINSFSASSLGLDVIVENKQQSDCFSSSIVRSGKGFASVFQNSQPISPHVYSANSLIPTASNTCNADLVTSIPMLDER